MRYPRGAALHGRFADAVIVAAGSSQRMGGVDKLDQLLLGRPLLAWSVEAMARADSIDQIVLVTRSDRVADVRSAPWLATVAGDRVRVVAGGERRADSVRSGLAATKANVVLVHDAARPLATTRLVNDVAAAASEHGAAVPVIPVVDSLKRESGGNLAGAIDREGLVRAQTPQGAMRDYLVDALNDSGHIAYTDEAGALEAAGYTVATVPGEAANIKVTDQDDLDLVRVLASGSTEQRFGYGEDMHGFGPGDGLMLGGLLIADAPRLYGHSDGDVVLHALATAVLSAAGLGDLGRLFPSSDTSTKGVASSGLVAEAVRQAQSAGWRVDRAQVSLVGARPRLGGRRLDEMRASVASILGGKEASVAIVASTGNLSGPEGAGRVIRATALVTVIRR